VTLSKVPKIGIWNFPACLRGVTLVVCAAHEGLKAAITRILGAAWQRCRVHFMRNAMAYSGKTQCRVVSA
jgi:putative transposase